LLRLDLALRQGQLAFQLPHLSRVNFGRFAKRQNLQIHLLEIGQGLQSFLQRELPPAADTCAAAL
jgi:hypothetical protein